VPDNKARAQQCVAEAQRLQGEGKLVEARAKAMEGMKLNATFGGDEVSPEFVFQQVANAARRKVDALAREAGDVRERGMGDPATRDRQAEAKLTEARALASSFQQDTGPIDAQLVALRAPSGPPLPVPIGGTVIQTVSHTAPAGHGQQLAGQRPGRAEAR